MFTKRVEKERLVSSGGLGTSSDISSSVGLARRARHFLGHFVLGRFGLAMTSVMLIFMLAFIAIAPPGAQAAIPRYINYQGKLTDANDDPVTGDMSITIRIYDAATGGTALWTETQTVTFTRGIFSILLGNTTALTSLDFNSAYWYSVEVASDGEMTPRQRLTAVGYAINADKLDGYDASQFLRADADTSLTGALTVSGSITGSANGDITLDPTGTGNIVMKIDSTSGDFKVTDGTTNYVLVDNATGNVTMSNDLTVSGTIYGTIASTGGSSTFSSLTVTGASDLKGNVSNSTGALTIADALTQTGSTNQVTFAGNVDADNGLDVTGALTVSGAATLSSALDMNSNIDLDYSGTSAALDVTQSSTGPAAQFAGGRVVVGANELTNANALSTGELYVLGDLEVDGTLYANVSSSGSTALGATTLSSLTVTGTSDLQGNISNSTGTVTVADYLSVAQTDSSTSGTVVNTAIQPTYQDSGTNSTTAATALKIAPTINYTGVTKTGSYTALKIVATETSLPTGSNYLIDAYAGSEGTTQKFYVDNSGNASFAGTVSVATPTAAGHAVTKAYADDITPATAGGWTDGGTVVYLVSSTDNVGIGTTSPGAALQVGDNFKVTSAGAVSGATGNISMWTNNAGYITDDTSVPKNNVANSGVLPFDWADDEVVDDLTISGGTINNSIIGGTTASAGTFNSLALSNTGSIPTFTFTDSSGSDTLTYTSTASYPFYFSDKVSVQDILIRGSSPAVLTFGSGASSVNLIYDPATDEIRFSRGTFAQDFRNLVKNGSFESFSAMQQFRSYDTAYTTATTTATEFGGMWDKNLGFQGGWQNFAPDDWTYVSGNVFQHAPTFFQTGFTATNIDANTWKEDFTEGVSAVRMAATTSGTPPVTAPGKISQVLANLKPSAVYSVGVKMRADTTGGTARVDIDGEEGGKDEGNTTTTLTADITATSTSLSASDVTNFPKFGTIRVTQDAKTEDIRYEGLDDTGGANKFLKCTRNASPHAFTSGATIKVTPFTPLQTTTDTKYKKFEGQFATDPKASEITISLSAETGTAYFDSVQIVTGGSVPEYTPNTVVDTGDQTIYGSLRIGRSSDEKGGILSVDKFVRARGVELFTDDPGLTGAMGGGATTMGGSGVFPPGPGWNNLNGQPASTQLFVSGTYTGTTSRDYKVIIGTGGTKYSWYYMDNSTGWLYQDGGIDISPLPTAETLLGGDSTAKAGIKIKFSSSPGTADDTWYFHASNETSFQGNMSFVKEATYTPGKTRIYVDPDRASTYYNKLVFEDGMTKVSLADLASAVTTNTPSYIGPVNRWTSNQGLLSMLALGSYVPVAPLSGNANYEVTIATNGTGTATSPSNDRFKYRINGEVWSAEQQITGGQQDIGNGLFISFGDPNFNGYYLSGMPGDTWTFTAFAGSTGTGKVTSLNSKTGVVTLEQGSNVTIDSSEEGKIRISATAVDGSVSNELNTSVSWNDATNTFSVTDAGGAKSVAITGFLESEVDGSTTNEINTFAADAGGLTAGLAVTLAGGGIVTTSRAGDTITITGTEVDGSTANEINTIAADSGGATTGLAITLAGGTGITTSRAGDTVTVTNSLGSTIESAEITDGTIVAGDIASSAITKQKLSELAPSADGSGKTISIAAGDIYVSGNTLKIANAATANFAAAGNCAYTAVASSKYIKGVIMMDSAGALSLVTAGSSEVAARATAEGHTLTYTDGKIPIVEVVLYTTAAGAGSIANIEALGGAADTKSYIYKDVRPFLNLGVDSVFKTVSVAGQTDVAADSPADQLTLTAGDNITITTNADTDTITITGGGAIHNQNTDTGTSSQTFEVDNDADAGAILSASGLTASDKTFTFPDATGKLVTETAAQTLTNKTLTTPLISQVYGSASANGDISIDGTSDATKTTSYVLLQSGGGNVGIGTDTPAQKLHTIGGVKAATDTTADADGYLYLGNDSHYLMWNDDYIGKDSQGMDVTGWMYTDTGVSVKNLEIRGASPATITFGSGATSKQLQFDSSTQEFSFTGGTLQQSFQNLVRGGDFETYKPTGWYSYWSGYNNYDYGYSIDSSTSKFGSKSLSIWDRSSSYTSFIAYYVDAWQRLRGKYITLSVWARAEGSNSATASVGISTTYTTEATEVQNIALSYDTANNTPWRNFICTFSVPSTAQTLRIYLYAAAGSGGVPVSGTRTIDGGGANSVYYDGITLTEGKLAMPFGPSPVFDTGDQKIGGSLAIGADIDPYNTGYMSSYAYYNYPRLIFGEPDSNFGGYANAYTSGSYNYATYGGGAGEISFRPVYMYGGGGSSGSFTFNRPIAMDSYDMSTSAWKTPALFIGRMYSYSGSDTVDVPDYALTTNDAYIKGIMETKGGLYGDVVSFYGGVGKTSNLISYSQDFSQNNWIKSSNLTVQTGSGSSYIAPDGTMTATVLGSTNYDSTTLTQVVSCLGNTAYTFSVYLSPWALQYAELSLKSNVAYSDPPPNQYNTYDGDITSANNTNGWYIWPKYAYCDLWGTTGWRRFRVTFTTPATATQIGARLRFWGPGSANGIKIWGAQLRQASSEGIYIPTSSSPVTDSNSLFHGDGSGLTNISASNISGSGAITGITGNTFTINEDIDVSTAPADNLSLIFKRGSQPNASILWDEGGDKFFINQPVNISSGDLSVNGTITAGSGANIITTVAGLLDATKLSGTVPSGSLPSGGYDTTYVNATGDTMTGALTLSPASGNALVTTAGNVGIGTTGPSEVLDVIGNIKTSSYILTTSGVESLGSGSTLSLIGGSAPASTAGSVKVGPMSFFAHTSGAPAIFKVNGSINQSGTAGYTGILLDVTESALGSGNKRLLDLQVGSSSKFIVDNAGNVTSLGTINGQTVGATSSMGTMNLSGDLTVGGNFTVNGTQTILNVETVEVESNSIKMNRNITGAPTLNASIVVERGTSLDTAIRWNETSDVWDLTKDGTNYYGILHTNTDFAGDVSGKYNNLQLGADVVGATELASTAIQLGDIEAGDLPADGYASTYVNVAGGTMTGSLTAASFVFDNSTLNAEQWSTASGDITLGPAGANILPSLDGTINLGLQAAIVPLTNAASQKAVSPGTITLSTSGAFTTYVDNNLTYRVEIDLGGATGVATYKWSRDGGATWVATGVATAAAATALENGLSIAFSAAGTAVVSDYWDVTITKNTGYKNVFANTITTDDIYTPSIRPENSGGTVVLTGNVEITGNLTTQGTQTIVGGTTYDGAQIIDITIAEAFLVRKNADAGDVFIVDTTNSQAEIYSQLGIGMAPNSGVELDVTGDADFSGTLKAGTADAFQVASDGAITSVGLNAGAGLITTSGNITTTSAGVMTSAGLLTASSGISMSGGNLAITDNSNIVLNTDKITLYGATGNATMAGTITQLRSIGMVPDYDYATLRGDGTDNFGTLTLNYGSSHNYYEWITSEPTTQDYDIVIRYRLPDGFSSFDATTPIKLWNKVSATPGATKVDVTMLDTAGGAVTLTGGSSLQNTSWTESTITLDAAGKTFTPGGYITIIIKMSADQAKVADVGELTFKGNW